MGKFGLMAGTAAIAMFAASGANAAIGNDAGATTVVNQPSNQVQLAQADMPSSSADLEARISALEAEVQDSEMRAAQAANAAPPPPPSGWWSNTSISGRMYFDVTNISNKANGVRVATATNSANGVTNGNGTNFDVKRFYLGVDHTFNDVYAANVTTDTTYDGTTGAGQIYLKKAYLQAKYDPAFTVRLGSADLPWVPYVEGLYGYRYLENVMIDRTKYGTSADWGVHVLGTLFDGILNYQISAVNGGGYKKTPVGADANRFNTMDFEGRISAVYQGFNLAIGGYTGKLATASGTPTVKTAERFDVLGAYVANGLRVGVEYFSANNINNGDSLANTTLGEGANGVSGFASYQFLPQFAVFGRYDSVNPKTKTSPLTNENYYTVGVTYSPIKIVDFSLAYKHDSVGHGTINTSNGNLGSATGLMTGSYNEIGLWGDLQW
jgi:hypothetical protein